MLLTRAAPARCRADATRHTYIRYILAVYVAAAACRHDKRHAAIKARRSRHVARCRLPLRAVYARLLLLLLLIMLTAFLLAYYAAYAMPP